MSKRAFIIHGWDGIPNDSWKKWLKTELEKEGFEVIAPQLPGGEFPKLKEWLTLISSLVKTPDNETYFIGHSLGCISILKYLEQLPKNSKIGGAILVSGFISSLKIKQVENFFDKPLNTKLVKDKTDKIIAIHSDNDSYVPIEKAYEIEKELNAKLIIEKSKGHYMAKEGIKNIPVLLTEILEISK